MAPFSEAQRELYGWILEYYQELQKHIRPGVTADQIMDETATADDASLRIPDLVEAVATSRPLGRR